MKRRCRIVAMLQGLGLGISSPCPVDEKGSRMKLNLFSSHPQQALDEISGNLYVAWQTCGAHCDSDFRGISSLSGCHDKIPGRCVGSQFQGTQLFMARSVWWDRAVVSLVAEERVGTALNCILFFSTLLSSGHLGHRKRSFTFSLDGSRTSMNPLVEHPHSCPCFCQSRGGGVKPSSL